jgi:hypothetical protein
MWSYLKNDQTAGNLTDQCLAIPYQGNTAIKMNDDRAPVPASSDARVRAYRSSKGLRHVSDYRWRTVTNNVQMLQTQFDEVSILTQMSRPEESYRTRNNSSKEFRQCSEYKSRTMMNSAQMLQSQCEKVSILIQTSLL